MKKNMHLVVILVCALTGVALNASAQFNSDSSQTFFVCDAAGSQISISAFADGSGGSYSFWIDKRNGAAGTAIYGQHLDSLGVPQWAANGKLFYQENGKEVWLMKAMAWQNGILISWVQGGFGAGGDTLFCNYYNQNGVSQWTQPTVAGNKQGNIIYVGFDDLDIYPNDSGATLTFGLTALGGNSYFSFNRIDFSGNLRWPLDTFSYQGNGYYYHTGDDHHDGFYVATSGGGLGTPIYLGHFDFQGNLTIPSPVDVTGTAGGRGNSQWKVLCDAAGNAYVIWGSYTNSDISISKIHPDGTMPWSDAKSVCNASGLQDIPEGMIDGNDIYAIWSDSRPGAANYFIYMQKLDTAGNTLWSADGVELCGLNSYIPYAKLLKSGTNIFATYLVSGGYRGQQIRPDSTVVWNTDGVVMNVNNPPMYGDYQLIPDANGSATAVWRESGDNICAVRVRPNGTLVKVTEQNKNDFKLYPNPAGDQFTVQPGSGIHSPVLISIYNPIGELILRQQMMTGPNGTFSISTGDFKDGFYFVKITNENYHAEEKICVMHQ